MNRPDRGERLTMLSRSLVASLRVVFNTRRSMSTSVETFRRAFSTESSASLTKTPSELDAVKEALKGDSSPDKNERMLIGFTCKCCQTRTHRTMSRRAYQHGIVLIECPGCRNRHLIADNLGWFRDTPQAAKRIEDMQSAVGEIRRTLNLTEDNVRGLVELLDDK